MRVDGKPKQTYIAFIASYEPEGRCDPILARGVFWRRARERLDKLSNRISPDDRAKIETALALRVKPTTAQENDQGERADAAIMAKLREMSGRR
jgi:hypothetical protein